jgi:hypothetical protein
MQNVAEVHETPYRAEPAPRLLIPLTEPAVCEDQVTPFHISITGREALSPTAVQPAPDQHETLSSSTPVAPGIATAVQLAPFHNSANADSAPVALVCDPTAMHIDAETHEIAPGVSLPWVVVVTVDGGAPGTATTFQLAAASAAPGSTMPQISSVSPRASAGFMTEIY